MFFDNVRIVGNTVVFDVNRLGDEVPMVKVLSVRNRWYQCELPFVNTEGWTIEFRVAENVDTYEGPTFGSGNLMVLISRGSEGYLYTLDGYMDCGIFQYRESFSKAEYCGICSDMWGTCPCIVCKCGFKPAHDVMWCTTKCVVCNRLFPECRCYTGFEEGPGEALGYWDYRCTCGAPDGNCDCNC